MTCVRLIVLQLLSLGVAISSEQSCFQFSNTNPVVRGTDNHTVTFSIALTCLQAQGPLQTVKVFKDIQSYVDKLRKYRCQFLLFDGECLNDARQDDCLCDGDRGTYTFRVSGWETQTWVAEATFKNHHFIQGTVVIEFIEDEVFDNGDGNGLNTSENESQDNTTFGNSTLDAAEPGTESDATSLITSVVVVSVLAVIVVSVVCFVKRRAGWRPAFLHQSTAQRPESDVEEYVDFRFSRTSAPPNTYTQEEVYEIEDKSGEPIYGNSEDYNVNGNFYDLE